MEVRERLQRHLDILFEDAPVTAAVMELKEELLANSTARYEDLVGRGMPEEDAYQSVIGNINDLIAALPKSVELSPAWEEERRSRSAVIVTVAIGLYVLAGAIFFAGVFLSAFWEYGVLLGLTLAVAMCIVPTCLLVYNAYRYPKYHKKEETVVEDFKAWNHDEKRAKATRGALSSLLWTITLIVYFLVSFSTSAWAISWVIFLIAACLESVLKLAFNYKRM